MHLHRPKVVAPQQCSKTLNKQQASIMRRKHILLFKRMMCEPKSTLLTCVFCRCMQPSNDYVLLCLSWPICISFMLLRCKCSVTVSISISFEKFAILYSQLHCRCIPVSVDCTLGDTNGPVLYQDFWECIYSNLWLILTDLFKWTTNKTLPAKTAWVELG